VGGASEACAPPPPPPHSPTSSSIQWFRKALGLAPRSRRPGASSPLGPPSPSRHFQWPQIKSKGAAEAGSERRDDGSEPNACRPRTTWGLPGRAGQGSYLLRGRRLVKPCRPQVGCPRPALHLTNHPTTPHSDRRQHKWHTSQPVQHHATTHGGGGPAGLAAAASAAAAAHGGGGWLGSGGQRGSVVPDLRLMLLLSCVAAARR